MTPTRILASFPPPPEPTHAELTWIASPRGRGSIYDAIEVSNYTVMSDRLYAVDHEMRDFDEIFYDIGGKAGWVSYLFARPGSPAARVLFEAAITLDKSPILCEKDYVLETASTVSTKEKAK